MSNTIVAVVVAGILVLAAAAFVGTAATGVQTTDGYAFNPVADEERGPVVVSRIEEGGFSIFGFTLGSVDRRVILQFVTPTSCTEGLDFGDTWPPEAACSTANDIEGTVEGLGTTADGQAIVAVAVRVSSECFERGRPGQTWSSFDC